MRRMYVDQPRLAVVYNSLSARMYNAMHESCRRRRRNDDSMVQGRSMQGVISIRVRV